MTRPRPWSAQRQRRRRRAVHGCRNVPEVDWREGTKCRTAADVCWIDNLSGTKQVRAQLDAGVPAATIVAGWSEELSAFDKLAAQYRIY